MPTKADLSQPGNFAAFVFVMRRLHARQKILLFTFAVNDIDIKTEEKIFAR